MVSFPDYIFIQNFKAIGKLQRIPVKPITLLFGQNSAGKSSVLHAIALMAHLSEHGLKRDITSVSLNGTEIRLGGYSAFQHKDKKNDKLVLGWRCKADEWSDGRDVAQFVAVVLLGGGDFVVEEYTVEENGKKVLAAERPVARNAAELKQARFRKGPMKLLIKHLDDSLIQTFLSAAKNELSSWLKSMRPKTKLSMLALELVGGSVLDRDLLTHFTRVYQDIALDECSFPPQTARAKRTHELIDEVKEYGRSTLEEIANSKCEETRIKTFLVKWGVDTMIAMLGRYIDDLPYSELRKVVYLGKYRPEIGVNDIFTNNDRRDTTNLTSAKYSKGWAFDEAAVSNLNDWLKNTNRRDCAYELQLLELFDSEAALPLKSKYLLRLFDKQRKDFVSFDDVGSGVGQLLPVLLAACGEISSVVLVEQPELHLHPALQAEIADAFIHSALGVQDEDEHLDNRFVLETHSEHILLRLMRRIRQTTTKQLPKGLPPIKPEDVAVLYVEKSPSGSGSVVRELRLNEMGELIDDWPGGFFEEGLREVLM
jgi:predicted ATPase